MTKSARFTSLEMIERLIGFDTVSKRSNLQLIEFVEEYLRSHGVPSERIVSADGRKANLWASLGRNPGEGKSGGIILSGHSDVVPVEGQQWSSDPFRAVIRNGRLYGRGSCDMKSFLAIALAMLPDFLEHPLRAPLHFAISYDEEVGCLGVRPMLAHIAARLAAPALAIIGEPTGMKVVNAHKSIHVHETAIEGLEAHSSATHKGANAIIAAARLIAFLDDMGAEMRTRTSAASGEGAGRADEQAARFDPPHASVQVGEIAGGEAVNIVPRHCRFAWEYRTLPGSDEDEILHRFRTHAEEKILPSLRRVASHASIETRVLASVPSFSAGENSPAEALALRLSTQRDNRCQAASYTTEAGLFENAGISAVVCGPGDIMQAHRPDEFISLEQINACEAFLHRLLEHLRV